MLGKRFIVVGGKGGVGRTTVAVSLATLLARRGRRVLLLHVRTRQRVARLLGASVEIDDEIRAVEPNLWAVNTNPQAALREKAMMVLRFKVVYRAVMENRVVKYFLRAVPALNEYSMLGKAWYHTTETVDGHLAYDTVIFDGPAMGHLITMLRIPQVICETVPDGPLRADAHHVRDLLQDPARTGLCIVALAEEMPAREAVELYEAARDDLRIAPRWVVVNALYPADLEREPALAEALSRVRAGSSSPELAPLLASAETLRARRAINRRYLDLLRQRIPLPFVELPHVFVPQLDRGAVDQLAARLEALL